MLPETFNLPTKAVEEPKPTPEELLQKILYFPTPFDSFDEVGELILPNIHTYADMSTDKDTAASLSALYRSHCVSLMEAVRYLQIKKFFGLFISFQGTLTAPVQKLFTEPAVAAWIEDSDWVTYKVC